MGLFAFWMQKFVSVRCHVLERVCVRVCVRACLLARARAVRDVWSCLLGGVARTDAILSSPHDSSDVNTKQAGHRLKKINK